MVLGQLKGYQLIFQSIQKGVGNELSIREKNLLYNLTDKMSSLIS